MRIVLGDPNRIQQALEPFRARISSVLAEVECLRTIDRLRLRDGLSAAEIEIRMKALHQWLEGLELINLDSAVLKRASEPFPIPLGTLDAIHLATALLWQEERQTDLIMATHDQVLARVAKAYGTETVGS